MNNKQGVAMSDEANTGWAEADAIIGRLMSDDPDFDDCQDAATFILRIYDEHLRGPDGYATWKEAAIAERVMRVKNVCPHGIHMDNACGACIPPRGTTVRSKAQVSRASSSRAEVESSAEFIYEVRYVGDPRQKGQWFRGDQEWAKQIYESPSHIRNNPEIVGDHYEARKLMVCNDAMLAAAEAPNEGEK